MEVKTILCNSLLLDILDEFINFSPLTNRQICIIFVIFRDIFKLQEGFVKFLEDFVFRNKSFVLLQNMSHIFFVSTFSGPKSGFVSC